MNKYVSHALAAAGGCLTGSASIVAILGFMFYSLYRMLTLQQDGVRIEATVVGIREQKVRLSRRGIGESPQDVIRTNYRVVARWQNPRNGKTYTLKTMIQHPEKYPTGSTISLLVDARHPRLWHRVANLQDM